MQAVYGNYEMLDVLAVNGNPPAAEFVQPDGLEKRPICNIASVTIGATECSLSSQEWFIVTGETADSQPTVTGDVVQWEELETAVLRIPALPLPALPVETHRQRDRR